MDIKYLDDVGTRHLIKKNNNTFVKKVDIVDNCTSDDSKAPLSANQGKHLQVLISGMKTEVDEQLNNISAETLAAAKSYTDTKTAPLASVSSVDTSIRNHNASTEAHNDIRELIADIITQMYGDDMPTDNDFSTIRDIAKDETSRVEIVRW